MLLAAVLVEVGVVAALGIQMALWAALGMVCALLRTNTGTADTASASTEPGATVEALSLGTLAALALALRLSLDLALLLTTPSCSYTNILRGIWLIGSLRRPGTPRSASIGSWTTCARALATETHEALHATLTSASV